MRLVSGAGHSPNCDGASGCGYSENHEAQGISDTFRTVCAENGIECDDCSSSAGSSSAYLKEQVAEANASGADLALQWHFNASDGNARGTTVIYYEGDDDARELAAKISAAVASTMGIEDRGPSDTCQYGSSRNLAFLNGCHMTALIVETAFIDNEEDMSAWAATPNRAIAAAVLSAISGSDASGGTEVEEDDSGMECIFQPNDENIMYFYDGVKAHPLANPDEVTAIGTVYQATHSGKSIPIFKLGSKAAPWATRFMDAINR